MLTLKQIDARLKTIGKRYTKINDDVQEIAVSIVNHANDTGDCDRAKKLCRAVPSRLRNLLIFWFQNVSPINVTIGKTVVDDKVSLRKEGKKNYMPFDVERAQANVWYENPFALPADEVLETLETYKQSIERLLDRMEKNTKDDAGKIDPEAVDSVKALRAHMRAAFLSFDTPADNADENGDDDAATVMARAAA